MSAVPGGLRGFFGCKVMGRERVFLFLVLPVLLVFTGFVVYRVLIPDSPSSKSLKEEIPELPREARLDPIHLIQSLEAAQHLESQAQKAPDQLPAALEAFRKLTRSNPENDRAWGGLGRCLLLQGDYPAAVQVLDQACRLNVVEAGHFAARAEARRHAGDKKGAMADYSDSLRLKPENPMVSNRMLLAAVEMENEPLYQLRLSEIAKSNGTGPDASWVIGAVAREIRGSNFAGAAALMRRAAEVLSSEQIEVLLKDPVFADRKGTGFLERYRAGEYSEKPAGENPAPNGN